MCDLLSRWRVELLRIQRSTFWHQRSSLCLVAFRNQDVIFPYAGDDMFQLQQDQLLQNFCIAAGVTSLSGNITRNLSLEGFMVA